MASNSGEAESSAEEAGLNGENVKAERRVLEVHRTKFNHPSNMICRLEKFGNVVECLTPRKRQWITEMGFDPLLALVGARLPRNLAYWLAAHVDSSRQELITPEGLKFPLSKVQVYWVLGLPYGPESVPYEVKDKRMEKEVDEIWNYYGSVSKGGTREIKGQAIVDAIECTALTEKEFKRAFFMFALNEVLCPTTCYRLSVKLLPAVTVYENAKRFDWCSLVLDYLLFYLRRFENQFKLQGYAQGCGGCSYFLVLFYLDRLKRTPMSWGLIPRIKAWSLSEVNKALNEDRTPTGDYDLAYSEPHPTQARDAFPSSEGVQLPNANVTHKFYRKATRKCKRKKRLKATNGNPYQRKLDKRRREQEEEVDDEEQEEGHPEQRNNIPESPRLTPESPGRRDKVQVPRKRARRARQAEVPISPLRRSARLSARDGSPSPTTFNNEVQENASSRENEGMEKHCSSKEGPEQGAGCNDESEKSIHSRGGAGADDAVGDLNDACLRGSANREADFDEGRSMASLDVSEGCNSEQGNERDCNADANEVGSGGQANQAGVGGDKNEGCSRSTTSNIVKQVVDDIYNNYHCKVGGEFHLRMVSDEDDPVSASQTIDSNGPQPIKYIPADASLEDEESFVRVALTPPNGAGDGSKVAWIPRSTADSKVGNSAAATHSPQTIQRSRRQRVIKPTTKFSPNYTKAWRPQPYKASKVKLANLILKGVAASRENPTLLVCEGFAARLSSAVAIVSPSAGLDMDYMATVSRLYTKVWQAKWTGRSRKIMLTPFYAKAVLSDDVEQSATVSSSDRFSYELQGCSGKGINAIFIPVLAPDEHWWAVVFSFNRNEIRVLDPSCRTSEYLDQSLKTLVLLKQVFPDWQVKDFSCWKVIFSKFYEPCSSSFELGPSMLLSIKTCEDRFNATLCGRLDEKDRAWLLYEDLMNDYNEAKSAVSVFFHSGGTMILD